MLNYNFEISEGKDYILITCTGELTRFNATQMNQKAHELGRANGISKYLVDVINARNVETITNNYEIAYKDMQDVVFDRTALVAFLAHPDDHSHDFVETVFQNAGLSVKLFREKEAALKFLMPSLVEK